MSLGWTLNHPLGLTALVVGLVALGFVLEERTTWGRRVGSSLLIILFGALLSNLELVPLSSPVYSTITGPITSLAIVWLLFAVDLRGLKAAGPRMLAAFALAVVATATGALTAVALVGDAFPGDAWRLAGVMTGTYAGGSLNFVAVGREVGLTDSLFVAATAADNVMTAVWVGATLMLPVWLAGTFRRRRRNAGTASSATEKAAEKGATNPFAAKVELRPVPLLMLFTLGLLLILVAETLSERIGMPSVLWLTSLALLIAQIPAVRRLEGALQLGLIALNLFFVVIGIGSRVAEIFKVGAEVFYFTAIVVAVHGVIVYLGAWLLRLDVESASVASQAAVGGPSTAMALAVARGWRHLTLPGVMVGLLGYAVGNYAGLLVAAWVRSGGGVKDLSGGLP